MTQYKNKAMANLGQASEWSNISSLLENRVIQKFSSNIIHIVLSPVLPSMELLAMYL